jgi:hypothetical protein
MQEDESAGFAWFRLEPPRNYDLRRDQANDRRAGPGSYAHPGFVDAASRPLVPPDGEVNMGREADGEDRKAQEQPQAGESVVNIFGGRARGVA